MQRTAAEAGRACQHSDIPLTPSLTPVKDERLSTKGRWPVVSATASAVVLHSERLCEDGGASGRQLVQALRVFKESPSIKT